MKNKKINYDQLNTLLKNKDDASFKIIFNDLCPQLSKYCHSILKYVTYDVIEDIIANAFIKYWHRRNMFTDYDIIKGYIFKIARNECVDYINKLKVQRRYIKTFEAEPSYNPYIEKEETQLSNKLKAMLLNAINSGLFKYKQLRVLELYWLKDLTPQQVSDIMGIEVAHVYKHSTVAIKKIRSKLLEALTTN